MSSEVEVSTGALLTITTGRFVVESFDEFHHAAEVVMGQPIFTHQFASDRVADEMRREAMRQHPWTDNPTLMDDFPAEPDADNCRAWVARISAQHGDRHVLVSPPETRHVPLVEGLPAKFGGAS